MNKAVLATLCFVAGATFGFAVGYWANREKEYIEPIPVSKDEPKPKEEPEPEKPQEQIFDIKPARIPRKPGDVGINYTKYVKDLQYKQETQSPPEDEPEDEENDISEEESNEDEIDMKEYEETYEERMERLQKSSKEQAEEYKREHKGKIELMPEDEWDTDFPENDYDREDIYYFTEDDVLTNESGELLDELETIGPKVRQVGWMQSPDENIYVRNHAQEKEYRVFKERCSAKDWF